MSQSSAGELLRAYYTALDRPDLDRLDALLAPDVRWSFPGATLDSCARVKRSLARSLAAGLTMQHDIGLLVEQGNLAFCELVATNRLHGQEFLVPGAVVCETAGGRITRLAAYPDAEAARPFLAALATRAAERR